MKAFVHAPAGIIPFSVAVVRGKAAANSHLLEGMFREV